MVSLDGNYCPYIIQGIVISYVGDTENICPVLSKQMLLLTRACEDLERERQEREEEKVRYLGEKLPPLQLSGLSMDELQVRVRVINHKEIPQQQKMY